jgi:hypothetical protein
MSTYDDLKAKVQTMLAAGQVERVPSREQRIDFAYGNTKIENEDVTREMAVRAVDAVERETCRDGRESEQPSGLPAQREGREGELHGKRDGPCTAGQFGQLLYLPSLVVIELRNTSLHAGHIGSVFVTRSA